VSSANINILLLTQFDKSFTNIKNNSGPNILSLWDAADDIHPAGKTAIHVDSHLGLS